MAIPDDLKPVLEAVFGVRPAGFSSVTPEKIDADKAEEIAALLPYKAVSRQSAVLAAQAVAEGLESVGLRPADYAGMEELSALVAKKLSKAIRDNPVEFEEAFTRQLLMRG